MVKRQVPSLAERAEQAVRRAQLLEQLATDPAVSALAERWQRVVEADRRASAALRRAMAERTRASADAREVRAQIREVARAWVERGAGYGDISAALRIGASHLRSLVAEGQGGDGARRKGRGRTRRRAAGSNEAGELLLEPSNDGDAADGAEQPMGDIVDAEVVDEVAVSDGVSSGW